MRIVKSVWAIFLVLLPVLVVIGVSRMMIDSNATFLPSYDGFFDLMARFPSPYDYAKNAYDALDRANNDLALWWEQNGDTWYYLTNIPTMFSLAFNVVGCWFEVFGYMFSYPFACVGWVFEFLFSGLNPGSVDPSTSLPVDSGFNPQWSLPEFNPPFNPAWS